MLLSISFKANDLDHIWKMREDTIDSIVYLLANKVDRWYICMETRLLGLFPGAATKLFIHE